MSDGPVSKNQSRETSPLDPPRHYDVNNDVMVDVTQDEWLMTNYTCHRLLYELGLAQKLLAQHSIPLPEGMKAVDSFYDEFVVDDFMVEVFGRNGLRVSGRNVARAA